MSEYTTQVQPERTCTDCGERKELRPYGEDGALVCISCAMKDESNAEQQFIKQFRDNNETVGNA